MTACLALADGRRAALLIVGLLLGVTLYHCSFGFSAAYRRLILRGEVRAIRAQLLMLAVATLAFAPLLAQGEFLGRPLSGAIAPFGVSMFFGAFLFGIGMQLGG
ncbi:MAG: YeeE/YedE family protein, partial [Candidatus Accumulibacter sp.]|nr:YeeE/YedE family protein [Accumulibacter sp.]